MPTPHEHDEYLILK